MKDRANSGVVEDIWMNTQASPDDFGRIVPTDGDSPPSQQEIEEENILLNPDVASMEGRG